jgi:hypothetical protein
VGKSAVKPEVKTAVESVWVGASSSTVKICQGGAVSYTAAAGTVMPLPAKLAAGVAAAPRHVPCIPVVPSKGRMRPVSHAAARWAQSVVRVLDCPFDPKTLALWAQAVGVSEGALRDRCRAARCRPKQSLDFARLLRAVTQSQRRGWDPFNLLDIVNQRTMKNLMSRGGVPDLLAPNIVLTPRSFLLKQHFVTDATAIEAVAAFVEP